jgi:cyclopropane-fatty-acyl-phospholipid synthase
MIQTDINELESLNSSSLLLSYNKKNILSIHDNDFLFNADTSIKEKVHNITDTFSNKDDIHSIQLVTIPKFFQKGFRPVSFYLCYSKNKDILGMVAEVTNTYGESHIYKLDKKEGEGVRFVSTKEFHVSPFFNEEGQYEFKVDDSPKKLAIHINYSKEDKKIFYANFVAKKRALNTFNILTVLFLLPFNALLIFPRILYQAAILFFIKKLPAKAKPDPISQNTFKAMPLSRFQRYILEKIKKQSKAITTGCLELKLPDSTTHILGTPQTEPNASLSIRNNFFFKSVASGGEIGFGESYVKGEWNTTNLPKLLSFFIINRKAFNATSLGSIIMRNWNSILHFFRRNTLKNSKQNIAEHYDLGNDFYSLFLDKSMMYSSAKFSDTHTTLEAAQENKVAALIARLNAKPGDHILEIGSGWGEVAITLAKSKGCKVTTITLSEEQHKLVTKRIQREKLTDFVEVKIQDYRHMEGQFDGVISVEMIEAVGHEYLPTYFKACNRLLKPGGKLVLQAITYPDDEYHLYRKRSDFIRKHIFPGGHLPSLGIMTSITQKHTDLVEIEKDNIAQSYAKTLNEWSIRFKNKETELRKMGFSTQFIQKWIYYFAYCEAGFKTDYLGCYQMTFEKRRAS